MLWSRSDIDALLFIVSLNKVSLVGLFQSTSVFRCIIPLHKRRFIGAVSQDMTVAEVTEEDAEDRTECGRGWWSNGSCDCAQ